MACDDAGVQYAGNDFRRLAGLYGGKTVASKRDRQKLSTLPRLDKSETRVSFYVQGVLLCLTCAYVRFDRRLYQTSSTLY